ncbi:MAG: hypothetical protein IT426_08830 [Pirellulales bacterium]|nr:hypothetical protein [Pirellulales bacterium]
MDIIQETLDVLATAEKTLASLASEAAAASQYDDATYIIGLAREISQLADKATEDLTHATKSSDVAITVTNAKSSAATLAVAANLPARRKPRKGEYPKFIREGDTLVKIGWSPSDKATYEHKSPKKVLALLGTTLSKNGANGKRFTMERVLPLTNPSDGSNVPDYQVYLCLAWLRTLDILIQHGRQGYSLKTKEQLNALIEQHWSNLTSR